MKSEQGFTLIELLVCVAIIGILAAIAIPQFSEYRTRAFDARAKSDLRNIISAQEAQFVNTETYVPDLGDLTGFSSESPAVSVILSASNGAWSGKTYHPMGSTTYCFSNTAGSGIERVSGVNTGCPWE